MCVKLFYLGEWSLINCCNNTPRHDMIKRNMHMNHISPPERRNNQSLLQFNSTRAHTCAPRMTTEDNDEASPQDETMYSPRIRNIIAPNGHPHSSHHY